MPQIQNSKGEVFDVSDVDAAQMTQADPSLTIVGNVDTSAGAGKAPITRDASALGRSGVTAATAQDKTAASHRTYLQDKSSTAGAFARGALSGASFGLTDNLFDDETLEADKVHHDVASGLGEVAGIAGTTLLAPEEQLGKLFGIGSDLSVERAASTLSSNALFGGELGAVGGAGTKFVERGIGRAKGVLGDAAERLAATGGTAGEDLAQLDAKGLRLAEQTEREQLAAAQVTERANTVGDITAYRDAVKQANPWLVVEGEPSALLSQSSKQLRGAMNDPIGLAKNPGFVLKSLRVQEQALTRALENGEEITAKLATRGEKFAKQLAVAIEDAEVKEAGEVALSGPLGKRYAAYADVKLPRGGELAIAPKKATEFLEALKSGEVASSEQKALGEIPKLVEQNRALQQRIEAAMVPKTELTSQRLAQIADARDALQAAKGGKAGITEQLVHGAAFSAATGAIGAIPVIGQVPGLAPLLGAKAASAVSDLVLGRIGKTSAEVAERTAKAVDSFFNFSKKAARAAPVLATRVLASVRYAERPKGEDAPTGKTTLAKAYVARAAELRSQTQYGPTGVPVMRPEARMKMAAQLDPIRALSPVFADRLETLAARRIEFLASKLPRKPDLPGMQFGHDNWHPSDMEMRTFARYAAAVEDPGGVEERLAGGKVTPEDAEVMRNVYPERYADLVRQIVEQASTKKLPYTKRLSLSMFADTALDPSLDPQILRALQATYTAEPGTGGGVQPPKPQPQFGSVKNQETTASQQRQGDL